MPPTRPLPRLPEAAPASSDFHYHCGGRRGRAAWLSPGRSFLNSFYPCYRGFGPDPFLPSGGETPSRPPMGPRPSFHLRGSLRRPRPVPGRGDPRARIFMCEGVAEPGTARGRRPDAAPPLTCPCGFRLRRKKKLEHRPPPRQASRPTLHAAAGDPPAPIFHCGGGVDGGKSGLCYDFLGVGVTGRTHGSRRRLASGPRRPMDPRPDFTQLRGSLRAPRSTGWR
ncbi:MAG: hypothetical protein CMLOHMNK_03349 [Steroidobacteraceae bacterium]|nr:hypothetical protein [Steroidobacteraceae bacterium]